MSVVLASIAVAAEPSLAGKYVMRNCNVPGQPPAAMGPWRAVPAPTTVLVDNCSRGEGFDFSLPWGRTMGAFTYALLDLDLPKGEAGHAIAFDRIRVWSEAQLTSSGQPMSVTGDGVTIGGAFGLGGLGSVGSPAQQPSVDADLPPKVLALNLMLYCGGASERPTRGAASEPDCYAAADVPLEVRGIEITLREDVAPAGSAIGGSLLGDKPASEVRSLDYLASDGESGIARVEALIGDAVVATRDLAGRCSFADWSACPTTDRDTLFVDTRGVPNGRYALRLRTTDAAGNRHDEQIQTIDVANGQTPPPAISPAAPVQLTARFAASTRSSLTVPFGRSVTLRGRLTGEAQSGLGGARIEIFERGAKAGAREIALGNALTRRDGTFSYTLASRRPTRTVRLAYGATVARLLRVRVRAASTLTASLRGRTVRFHGRVLSRPLPAAGKRVVLQGKAPGYAWATFATVRTNRLGQFSGSYRLPVRRPGVRLQIRARVPIERGYPYLTYTSRPIVLRVR